MILRSAIACALCALACVTGVSAETSQGVLRGAIRDPLGVIPGAEVTLIHERTRAQRSAMTNEAGEYAFTRVPPGTYTVRVSLPGFKAEARRNVRVGARRSLVVDFTLHVMSSEAS